ncbi:hypothetical protein NLI96_g4282 [Meripilus lineatus]|uniref:Uncharacterized protein n=1 Tax=Meripilus lineatus TaxID=2056292 RepID=A0AAD5V7E4_9APHY|nr:hypothetical protein NLI96_g4282 [Physisporinus lineatus]
MPEKSGFRPRPKAFTGGRKPFNLAKAQANADSGWSRRKPEDESSQTSPTKSHSAYENVKVKVRDFFKRGPAPSLDSEREARNRQVADELFPPEEPVAIRGRRERVIEFDINSRFEPLVLDTQPTYYDAVMDDNASVFSWSSAETLVNDVQMQHDDTSDLDYILQYNSPKAQEDWDQDALCELFVSRVTLKTNENSEDSSFMDVDEASDEIVDVTMLSLSGNHEPSLGDISMEVLVKTSAPGAQSGSSLDGIEPQSISTVVEINVCISRFLLLDDSNLHIQMESYYPGWATPRGVIRTSKSQSLSSRAAPYSRQDSAISRLRPRHDLLAGLKEFINGGPSRGKKGRLVNKFSTLVITRVVIPTSSTESEHGTSPHSVSQTPTSETSPIPPIESASTVIDAHNGEDNSDSESISSPSPDEAPLSIDDTEAVVDSFLNSIDLGGDTCDLPDFEDVEKFYASAAGRSEKTKEDRKQITYTPYIRPTTSTRNKDATAPRRPKKVPFVEDPVDLESQRLEELASQIASLNVAEEEDTNEQPPVGSNTPVSDREALLFIIDALEDVQQYN